MSAMDRDVPAEDEQVIPRVIHWIWLGDRPIPDIFTHYLDSWRRHHPAWQFRVWRDDTLPPLSCQAEYERLTNFKIRYDTARLEILRQFGGVVLDLDVEAIRPIDPLLRGTSAFVGRLGRSHIGNQVLGAVPHHPFFELATARLRAALATGQSSSDVAGKSFLKQLLDAYPDGVTVFPGETFNFSPSFDPPKDPDAYPAVFAVHHELTSYVEPPAPEAMAQAVAAVLAAADMLRAALEEASGPATTAEAAARTAKHTARARARLDKAGSRLQKAIDRQREGYEAVLRRTEAAAAQAEVRSLTAQRELRRQIATLEDALRATHDQLSRAVPRS